MLNSVLLKSLGVNHGFCGREYDFSALICDHHAMKSFLDTIKVEELYMPMQVHGNSVASVYSAKSADAVVCVDSGIAIAIRTADCVPVLFFDKVAKIIGVAHVGWQGALLGVIGKTIDKMVKMGSTKSNIVAAIGPCVSVDSYEVNDSFNKMFDKKYFKKEKDKLFFDLLRHAEDSIIFAGIKEVDKSVVKDTYTSQDFFSYRRDGGDHRNISYIAL